jgi:hypothetical protein
MPRIRFDLPRFMPDRISLFPQFDHRKNDGDRVRELASFASDAKFCASRTDAKWIENKNR